MRRVRSDTRRESGRCAISPDVAGHRFSRCGAVVLAALAFGPAAVLFSAAGSAGASVALRGASPIRRSTLLFAPTRLQAARPYSGRRHPSAAHFLRPRVVSEPQSETVVLGQQARFSARAIGKPKPRQTWQVSTDGGVTWSTVIGDHSDALAFITTAEENNDLYRAKFVNRVGSRFSRPARLDVTNSPVVEVEPSNAAVLVDSSVTFAAFAAGNPMPSVQWQYSSDSGASWTTIPGATGTSYTLTAVASESGNEYEAVFTNSVGVATTSAALLVVGDAPSISSQPSTALVTDGESATFTAAATGSPAPSVQWEQSSDDGASWTPIPGATSTSYVVVASAALSGERYEAVFTNVFGSATTLPASLAINVTSPALAANWAGYAVDGGTFNYVTGDWTVPTLTCGSVSSTEDYYSAQWIGVDGYNGDTVEQDGTEADCIDGTPQYDAWWELYGAVNDPDPSVNNGAEVALDPALYPVSPGDFMESWVTESTSGASQTWTFNLVDRSSPGATPNWTFTQPETVTGFDYQGGSLPAMSSVEWIAERPALCTDISCSTYQLTSLAPFGSVMFTDATAKAVGSTTFQSLFDMPNFAIEMTSNGMSTGTILAVSGPIQTDGKTFAVTWYAPD